MKAVKSTLRITPELDDRITTYAGQLRRSKHWTMIEMLTERLDQIDAANQAIEADRRRLTP